MSRRERLEGKLARREEWAGKADARSEAAHERVRQVADAIPFGQPILVGHHSERHARRDAERIRSGMDRAVSESNLAEHHRAKASGLEAQLERSVFSDDVDAVAQLEKRIAEREAECAHMKAVNAAFKKAAGVDNAAKLVALVEAGVLTAGQAFERAKFFSLCSWETKPFPAYASTNLRGSIARDRKRIDEIKARAARTERAEQAGGVAIEPGPLYTRVTFAEKPARDVLEALKAAGYAWGQGQWIGASSKLPACVSELAKPTV